MIPDREGVGEPVDVFGHAELRDPGLVRRGAVALRVLGGEELVGRRRVGIVRPQVQVIVREHRQYASQAVVHLRIVVPSHQSGHALDLLQNTPSVCNLIFLERAAQRPEGDVILVDVAREDASVIISDLKELEIHKEGSIAMEDIDSQISEAAERAEQRGAGAADGCRRVGGGGVAHVGERRALGAASSRSWSSRH